MASDFLLTNSINGYLEAYSKTISAVLSVELSLTTTNLLGKTVCSTNDCKVKAIKASSL